ncbi:MAG: hypothetical protein OEZ41_13830, partial [Nitrospirota bacterium]|nr:hypothetical protein [Nitrospirota bacterium]
MLTRCLIRQHDLQAFCCTFPRYLVIVAEELDRVDRLQAFALSKGFDGQLAVLWPAEDDRVDCLAVLAPDEANVRSRVWLVLVFAEPAALGLVYRPL